MNKGAINCLHKCDESHDHHMTHSLRGAANHLLETKIGDSTATLARKH